MRQLCAIISILMGDLSSLFYIYVLWFSLLVVQQAFLLFLLSDSLRRQLLFNHCQRQVPFLRGLISIQGLQRTATKKTVLNSNIRLEES